MNIDSENNIKKSDVVKYWYENVKSFGRYFCDIGEPNCWACGKPISKRFDCENPNFSDEECYKIWDKVGHLQICHIVPKSLSGTNHPSNLFLMCKHCHEEAPDTIFPELFFEWVDNKSYYKDEFRNMETVFEYYNIKITNETTEIFSSKKFSDFIKDKTGSHRSIFGGNNVKLSSLVALLKKYIELNKL